MRLSRCGIAVLVVAVTVALPTLLLKAGDDPPAAWGNACRCALVNTGHVSLAATGQRSAMSVTLERDPQGDPDWFAVDYLRIVLRRSDGPTITHRFTSTYGTARLDILDLTGNGIEELVLRSGMGRGTSVRSERLCVFRVKENRLERVLVTPLSGWFMGARSWDGTGHWEYVVDFTEPDGDGACDINMRLTHDPTAKGKAPRDLPSVTELAHRWDRRQKKFVTSTR